MASSGQSTKLICFDAVRRHSLSFLSTNRAVRFQHAQIKGFPQQMPDKRMVQGRRYQLGPLAMGTSDICIGSPSPTHIIRQFYSNINQKNLNLLDRLLSNDCFFEDYSFPKPFQGKKEVLNFLEQLTTSMGQNVEFNVEHICEAEGYTAVVKLALSKQSANILTELKVEKFTEYLFVNADWKKKQVPFTRGCSYYELSRDGERLVIKKIQVIIESPLKPGGFALAFFKIITSLFDAFPDAAERFLNSPHLIFQLFLKLYHIVLKPIFNPFIAWYVKIWSLMFHILSFTLKILYHIVKIFKK